MMWLCCSSCRALTSSRLGWTGNAGPRCTMPSAGAPEWENLQLGSAVIPNRWGKSKEHLLALGRKGKKKNKIGTVMWDESSEYKGRNGIKGERMDLLSDLRATQEYLIFVTFFPSGTVTHLEQDLFIIRLQLNYKGSSQTKSTLKMGLKKTKLQRSSGLCTLPQTTSGWNK